MRRILTFLTSLLLVLQAFSQNTQDSALKKYKIVKFAIHEEIAPAATRRTMRAFEEADRVGADLIVLDMDTYGGLVSDADSIRTRILNSTIPVYVFIHNNAASAGALISIACNKIYMRQGATIGAATVVNQEGQKVPDKYQSYMRSKMRATAEARGRNPDIAQAMVDGDIVVEGVNDSGKIVTLTTTEAIKHGFCDGQAETVDAALKLAGITEYTITEVVPSTLDKILGFLMNPGVSGTLVVLIFLGIYYELQAPGLGLPTVVAVTAAALYFAPLYLEGLAANWEILLFIGGFALLAVEIFVIPGFGIAGISGIVLIFVALVLSLVRNVNFDFSYSTDGELTAALTQTALSLLAFVVFLIAFGGAFLRSRFFKRLVLNDDLSQARMNTIPVHTDEHLLTMPLAGNTGICFADLKPQGKVKIGDRIYPATSLGEYIEKGAAVTILKEEGGMLVVRKDIMV